MSFQFNPLAFAGLDLVGSSGVSTWGTPVADVASLPATGSDGEARVVLDQDAVYLWDDTSSQWIKQELGITTFGNTPNANGLTISTLDSGNVTETFINLQPADASNPGAVSTGTQSFAGNKTFTGNVVVSGDFEVNGTTTTVNTATLDVTDANITINNGGTDASAEGAGLTVERLGTDACICYEDALASKFKIGAVGSEHEIMTVGHVQTITANKTMSGTLTMSALTVSQPLKLNASGEVISALISNADVDASAAIDATKIGNGDVDNTELSYLNGVTSAVQTQLDNKQPLDSTLTSLAAYNTNGVLTQTAPDTFVGRTLTAGSTKLSIANGDGVAGNPTLDVSEANVDHDNLLNFVANEHIDHSSVNITTAADSGLTGGGDITASRSISVDIDGTTEETAIDNADTVLIFDNSAGALRKITRNNLLGNSTPSAGDVSETEVALLASQTSAYLFTLDSQVRAARVLVSAYVDADTDEREVFEVEAVTDGTNWNHSISSVGNSQVTLGFNNLTGEITYDSPSYVGFNAGTSKFKYRLISTTI